MLASNTESQVVYFKFVPRQLGWFYNDVDDGIADNES